MLELSKTGLLDLANAFAGELKGLGNFLEGVCPAIEEAVTHGNDCLFSLIKGGKNIVDTVSDHTPKRDIGSAFFALILDEFAECHVFVVANRRFQRYRVADGAQVVANF